MADEPRSDTLRAYYAARAAEYDRIYAKPERQADLAALRHWLPPHFGGKRVLEVACGTGHWSQFIAPVAASLLGIDAAEETLQIARSRCGTDRPIHFQVGDAYALAPDLGRFDAGFAGFWYSHVPKRRQRAFLTGFIARLEQGSPVVLIDNRLVDGSSTPISDRDHDGDTFQQRRLDDGSIHRVLKNFLTDAELRAAVAGLATDVEVTLWPHYWALSFRSVGQ